MAELSGYVWEHETSLVTQWDGLDVEVEPGDMVAGYMDLSGTLIVVTVYKHTPENLRLN